MVVSILMNETTFPVMVVCYLYIYFQSFNRLFKFLLLFCNLNIIDFFKFIKKKFKSNNFFYKNEMKNNDNESILCTCKYIHCICYDVSKKKKLQIK